MPHSCEHALLFRLHASADHHCTRPRILPPLPCLLPLTIPTPVHPFPPLHPLVPPLSFTQALNPPSTNQSARHLPHFLTDPDTLFSKTSDQAALGVKPGAVGGPSYNAVLAPPSHQSIQEGALLRAELVERAEAWPGGGVAIHIRPKDGCLRVQA